MAIKVDALKQQIVLRFYKTKKGQKGFTKVVPIYIRNICNYYHNDRHMRSQGLCRVCGGSAKQKISFFTLLKKGSQVRQ